MTKTEFEKCISEMEKDVTLQKHLKYKKYGQFVQDEKNKRRKK